LDQLQLANGLSDGGEGFLDFEALHVKEVTWRRGALLQLVCTLPWGLKADRINYDAIVFGRIAGLLEAIVFGAAAD
jgi:hypothetical protein